MRHTHSPRASSRRRNRSFTIHTAVESLEMRAMLHGTSASGSVPANLRSFPAEVLAKMDDGHFTTAEYLDLSIEQQALVSPHQIEDDRPLDEQLAELGPLDMDHAPITAGGDAGFALPDLVPLTNGSYLKPYIDMTEQPGRALLRFTTAVGNQGAGPAILYSGNTAAWQTSDGRQLVKQKLYTYNGSTFTTNAADDRDGGHFIFHPTHGHFHLENYAIYRLLDLAGNQIYRPDGTPAIGDKVGFCLVNIANSFTTTSGASSTTLPGYSSSGSNGQPSTSCGFVQGIHVGRADVYDSQYDGQWIDVTGVPAGSYQLEVTLDGSNALMESNETNNTVRVPATITANNPTGGIALDRFESPVPNNDITHATDLGELGVQTQSGLTMHADSDTDWFKFTAASSGAYSVQLSVANRIVDLYLYDEQHKEIGLSTNPAAGSTANPVTQNINYNFEKGHTYYVKADGFAGSDLEGHGDTGGLSTNYALKVLINPTVVDSSPLATASEDGLTEGSFKIDRNGPFSSALTVNFVVGGTATRGVDYDLVYNGNVLTANSLIIGVESLSETIRVVPKTDTAVEPTETVTITLSTNSAYVVGAGAGSALVNIIDTAPTVLASVFKPLTNSVSFDFSLDVSASLAATDLILTDAATGLATAVTPATFAWSPATNTATFTLDGPLPRGNFVAILPATSVTHAQGAPLAADAVVNFAYLPADGNLDGVVDFADLVALSQQYGLNGSFAQGDYNYDDNVDFNDLVILSQNYNLTAMPPIGGRAAIQVAVPGTQKTRTGRVAADVL